MALSHCFATHSYDSSLLFHSRLSSLHNTFPKPSHTDTEICVDFFLSSVAFSTFPLSNYQVDTLTDKSHKNQQGELCQHKYETKPHNNPYERDDSRATHTNRTIFSIVIG